MSCTVLDFLLFLWTINTVSSLEVTFTSKDIQAPPEDSASLTCSFFTDQRNPVCIWVAPDSTEYNERGIDERVQVRQEEFGDKFICTLNITRLQSDDQGPWNCLVNAGDEETQGKYIFIKIEEGDRILPSQINLKARERESVTLLCPTTIRPGGNAEWRPVCIWFSPEGKKIDILGSNGVIYDHPDFEVGGNPDRGDCGIRIKSVKEGDEGTWKCRVIPRYSQEILEWRIRMEVERNLAIVSDNFRQLEKTFNESFDLATSDQISAVYWILRREVVLQEGTQFCFSGGDMCVESSLLSAGDSVGIGRRKLYNINITYSNIQQEDLASPLVLVVEWRDANGQDRQISKFQKEREEWRTQELFNKPECGVLPINNQFNNGGGGGGGDQGDVEGNGTDEAAQVFEGEKVESGQDGNSAQEDDNDQSDRCDDHSDSGGRRRGGNRHRGGHRERRPGWGGGGRRKGNGWRNGEADGWRYGDDRRGDNENRNGDKRRNGDDRRNGDERRDGDVRRCGGDRGNGDETIDGGEEREDEEEEINRGEGVIDIRSGFGGRRKAAGEEDEGEEAEKFSVDPGAPAFCKMEGVILGEGTSREFSSLCVTVFCKKGGEIRLQLVENCEPTPTISRRDIEFPDPDREFH